MVILAMFAGADFVFLGCGHIPLAYEEAAINNINAKLNEKIKVFFILSPFLKNE